MLSEIVLDQGSQRCACTPLPSTCQLHNKTCTFGGLRPHPSEATWRYPGHELAERWQSLAGWSGDGPERGSACFVTASSGDRRAVQQKWSAAETTDGPLRRRCTGCVHRSARYRGWPVLSTGPLNRHGPLRLPLLARHASSADL